MNDNQHVCRVKGEAKALHRARLKQSAQFAMVRARSLLKAEKVASALFIAQVISASGAYVEPSPFIPREVPSKR